MLRRLLARRRWRRVARMVERSLDNGFCAEQGIVALHDEAALKAEWDEIREARWAEVKDARFWPPSGRA